MVDKVIGAKDVILILIAAVVIGILKYATDQREMIAWIGLGVVIGIGIVLGYAILFGDVGILYDSDMWENDK